MKTICPAMILLVQEGLFKALRFISNKEIAFYMLYEIIKSDVGLKYDRNTFQIFNLHQTTARG